MKYDGLLISVLILYSIVILSGCVSEQQTQNQQQETKVNEENKNNQQQITQNLNNTQTQQPIVTEPKNENKDEELNQPQVRKISMTEVAKHNKPEDCWSVIHGKVYNFSNAAAKHPGGEAIYLSCGKDGTNLFESKPNSGRPHSQRAREYLQYYYLGELE
ncbi:MAG: cytochrome b5 domain-containing protein [Candidatus Micrarchaeota archaeon]|nr:cytochrome b5 domain-containing protein [Candidatus Micrarchaeota archaeon]